MALNAPVATLIDGFVPHCADDVGADDGFG